MAKILVIDDEPSLTDLLRELLSREGYQVVVGNDSSQAMRIVLQERPDLALIDYRMPGKTGVELVAELRAGVDTRLLPVLFLSGTEAVRFAGQVPPEPRVRFLLKPVDLQVLLTMVREMLDPNNWSAHPPRC